MDAGIIESPWKKVAPFEIEGAVADAISELSGSLYRAELIRMESEGNGRNADDFQITLRLSIVLEQTVSREVEAEGSYSNTENGEDKKPSIDRSLTGLTGRRLNQEWEVGARHALYHHEGQWYHQLQRFPGALFDYNGYVLFETREAFETCPYLNIRQDVHVPQSIAAIPGYIRRRR